MVFSSAQQTCTASGYGESGELSPGKTDGYGPYPAHLRQNNAVSSVNRALATSEEDGEQGEIITHDALAKQMHFTADCLRLYPLHHTTGCPNVGRVNETTEWERRGKTKAKAW
ncbi:unnamed protein product [Mesocestoides corti]|uniref:Uncharacterized protein n=1 Tax=Mesocestoides corti TaxID=53468 RepID=A0A0R3UNE4_MESCO|nr:unnamed protein product [Mesocestoides corti]